jgi:hypothetical protein
LRKSVERAGLSEPLPRARPSWKHGWLVRPTRSGAGIGLTERRSASRENTYVKRTSTTTPGSHAVPAGRARIGKLVFIPRPDPANDTNDRRVALLALVDDLALLAAELCFSGRIRRENRTGVIDDADKKGPR